MTMEQVSNSQFDPNSSPAILLDFWAEWCMPCRALAPRIEKLSQEITSVKFIKADADDGNADLLKKYGVSSIPCLVLFKNGQVVDKIVGAQSEDKIREALSKIL